MAGPVNAFELLEKLREKTGKQVQGFSAFSNYLGMKAREKNVPLSGLFELTPLCNFDCRMCYIRLAPEQMDGQTLLPVGLWKTLMQQAWAAGMLSATLTGGECLTYPGFDELYLFLQSLGCRVIVLTNAFLLDADRVRFFRDHMPAKLQITLYGQNDDVYERVTGRRAFGIVSENIRRAVEAGLPVSLSVTPSGVLGEDALETLRTATALCPAVEVNSCIFPPREDTGRSSRRDEADTELYMRLYRLQDELRGRTPVELDEDRLPPCGGPSREGAERGLRCGAGRSAFSIDWQGTMSPCNNLVMIRAYPLRDGFPAAWESVNREARSWPGVPACEGCAYVGVCANCPANMLRFAEPGQQPVGLCEQTRFLVRHGVRHIPACE